LKGAIESDSRLTGGELHQASSVDVTAARTTCIVTEWNCRSACGERGRDSAQT